MKLGTTLTTLGMALSLAACGGMNNAPEGSLEVQEPQTPVTDTIYAADLTKIEGHVEEFTPKGNPNYTCVAYDGTNAGAISCFPKAGTPTP